MVMAVKILIFISILISGNIFAENLKTFELSHEYVDFTQVIQAMNYNMGVITEKKCSLEISSEIKNVINLYEIYIFQSNKIGDYIGSSYDLNLFLLYAKLGYIYDLSNMKEYSDYYYFMAASYGSKFNKNLTKKESMISLIKKSKLGCMIVN